MKSLNIPDGLEEYSLNDRVMVRFNPTDLGFLERVAAAFEKLDAIQEEVRASREKITDEREVFPLARELDAKMRAILNELFDADICTPLFGGMNLFASSGGLPVWANLMLAVSEEAENAMSTELAQREKRISKYVKKYELQSSINGNGR